MQLHVGSLKHFLIKEASKSHIGNLSHFVFMRQHSLFNNQAASVGWSYNYLPQKTIFQESFSSPVTLNGLSIIEGGFLPNIFSEVV